MTLTLKNFKIFGPNCEDFYYGRPLGATQCPPLPYLLHQCVLTESMSVSPILLKVIGQCLSVQSFWVIIFLGDNMYGQEIDDDKNSTDWNKPYLTKKGGETKNKVLLN